MVFFIFKDFFMNTVWAEDSISLKCSSCFLVFDTRETFVYLPVSSVCMQWCWLKGQACISQTTIHEQEFITFIASLWGMHGVFLASRAQCVPLTVKFQSRWRVSTLYSKPSPKYLSQPPPRKRKSTKTLFRSHCFGWNVSTLMKSSVDWEQDAVP